MIKTWTILMSIMIFVAVGAQAQLGIRAGVNMANEIKSFTQGSISEAFSSENLTGYHIGIMHQSVPEKSGFGGDIAMLFSQKGSSYTDATDANNPIVGYRELNYFEMPFNVRYQLRLGFATFYASSGLYAAYFLSGKDVAQNAAQSLLIDAFVDRLDFGYSFGGGVELFRKIQLGASWSRGLRSNNAAYTSTSSGIATSQNNVFSINLGYLF